MQEVEESIYNLIPRAQEVQERPPRYRSQVRFSMHECCRVVHTRPERSLINMSGVLCSTRAM